MSRYNLKLSVRMSENLKTRVKLLAVKNDVTFTKMLNYLLELGYESYIERFEKYDREEVLFYE